MDLNENGEIMFRFYFEGRLNEAKNKMAETEFRTVFEAERGVGG